MEREKRQHITTIVLDEETHRLLDVASEQRGVSRSEFIRNQLRRVLAQYKSHPKPRSAGAIKKRRINPDKLFAQLEK